ncbi:MAG: VCBS repeat-containing protein [Acidobacteriota bacterium]
MQFPINLRSALILSWLLIFAAAFTNAQNPACYAPGELVVTDAKGENIPDAYNIDQVFVAEPLNGSDEQTLLFTMKVKSLHAKVPGTLPSGTWNVVFTDPSGISRYVQMSTLTGTPIFTYGTVGKSIGLKTYKPQGSAAGTFNSGGLITIRVNKLWVGKPSIGVVLTIEARSYNGSGQADVTPSSSYQITSNGNCNRVGQANLGVNGDVPVARDYTQNGTADVAVWRPTTGAWYSSDLQSKESNMFQIGVNGDIPVAGDYDGDGRGDHVVYRPSTGTWFIHRTETDANFQMPFGADGDLPVAGDFDGDGSADIAVYRPGTGVWFVVNSSNQAVTMAQWGNDGDQPVAADFDGDGRTDIAVFRPATGVWYALNSSNSSVSITGFGASGDVTVPADYDGDGKADVAIWRPETGNWYVLASGSGSVTSASWGATGDIPQARDFNGNGRADFAVWRPSTGDWFVVYN